MPFKSIEKRRKYRREWYSKNKKSEKEHVRKRKLKLRNWFKEYKQGLNCSKCGENHVATIEFHHNSAGKEMEISKMVSEGYSVKRITQELKKCIVLCSNCHKKTHYGKNNI